MKNFSFAIFSNTLSLIFISFVISFFLVNYFTDYRYALIISATLALLFAVFYVWGATAKRNKKINLKKSSKDFEQTFVELNIMSTQKINATFTRAFEKCGKKIKKIRNGVYLPEENKIIYFAFGFDGVKKADVIKAYNLIKKDEKVYIYSSCCDNEIKKFIDRFDGFIKLASKKEIFSVLEKSNCLPKATHFILDENYRKKPTLKGFFKRKKAKSFLAFGLSLCFMSLFVRYKVYYLVFGIMFLVFFSISFFFGEKEIN